MPRRMSHTKKMTSPLPLVRCGNGVSVLRLIGCCLALGAMARAAAWCEYWLAACLAGTASCAAAVVEVALVRRVCRLVVTAVAVAGLGSVLLAGVGPVLASVPSALAGGWDKAIEVPGTAALNKGGIAEVRS